MTRRHVSRHLTGKADTLDAIARQYRLSSERAIRDAPDNARILDGYRTGDLLAPGVLIAIPPNVMELVKERIYMLDRIRPAVLEHFVVQERLLERDVLRVDDGGDFSKPSVVQDRLESLQKDMGQAIASLAEGAKPLNEINTALSTTHMHATLAGVGGTIRHADHAGLAWLCGIDLYPAWLDMWSTPFWVSRWRGVTWPEAGRSAGLYLNVIRSKVVQNVDARLRESNTMIQQLMLERLD